MQAPRQRSRVSRWPGAGGSVGATPGTYTATCTATRTNRGLFELRDPQGHVLGRANVGTAYTSDVLNFTIADGSTDFLVGDVFSVVVAGSASLAAYDFTADSAPPQIAAAVLGEDIDTTTGAASNSRSQAVPP